MKKLINSPYLVTFVLLSATLFWGMSFLWLTDVVDAGVSSMTAMAFRYGLATAIMLPFVAKQFKNLTKKDVLGGCVLGALMLFAVALQTEGLKYTTPANSAFITTSYVMLVPGFAWLLLKQRPRARIFLPIGLCLLGLYFLNMRPGEGLSYNLGNVLTLFCAIAWAVQVTYITRVGKNLSSAMLAFIPMAFSAVVSTAYAAFTGGFALTGAQLSETFLPLLYCALFPTIGAGAAQAFAQKRIDPSRAAIVYTLESVFACLLSIMFGYETLSLSLALGGGLIVGAIIIAEVDLISRIQARKVHDGKGI